MLSPSRCPRASPRSPVAPDLGERYLDTVYRTNWLQDVYGDQILDPEQMTATIQTEEPAPRRTGPPPTAVAFAGPGPAVSRRERAGCES